MRILLASDPDSPRELHPLVVPPEVDPREVKLVLRTFLDQRYGFHGVYEAVQLDDDDNPPRTLDYELSLGTFLDRDDEVVGGWWFVSDALRAHLLGLWRAKEDDTRAAEERCRTPGSIEDETFYWMRCAAFEAQFASLSGTPMCRVPDLFVYLFDGGLDGWSSCGPRRWPGICASLSAACDGYPPVQGSVVGSDHEQLRSLAR